MTAVLAEPMSKASENYLEETISFNIKVLLAAKNLVQADLAYAIGIKRSAMSQKLSGRTGWSIVDLVNAASYLDTSVEALLDDSLMMKMGAGMKKATGEPAASKLPQLGLNQRHFD